MSSSNPLRFFFLSAECPDYLTAAKPLYERKAVTDLWNRLTEVSKKQWKWKNVTSKAKKAAPFVSESNSRLLQVFGPPGSGKSCATYHWVERFCQNLNVKGVWLSCATNDGKSWEIQFNEGTRTGEVENHDVMTAAADYEGYDVVVFDGIRESTVETWRGLMNDLARLGIAVIVVSSEGVKFHEGDSADIMKPEYMVPSWIPEEYVAASSDDIFWGTHVNNFEGATVSDNPARRKELLDEKFVVAGYSARYMFGLKAEQVESLIRGNVESMGGNIDALEKAVKGTRSVGFVNSLVARLPTTRGNGATPPVPAVFPTQHDTQVSATGIADLRIERWEFAEFPTVPRIVSTYAVQKMIVDLPSDIKRLRAIARQLDNRAIEGYAFEEQLKKSLVEAQAAQTNLVVHDVDGVLVQCPVHTLRTNDANEVVAALKSGLPPNTWIFVAGRQGAFDAVHVQSATHWRFVQITVGKRHTYLLRLIEILLRDVGNTDLTHVEFMILRPESERRNTFYLDHADGGNQLRVYKCFDEQSWRSADYYRINAKQAFLDWTDFI